MVAYSKRSTVLRYALMDVRLRAAAWSIEILFDSFCNAIDIRCIAISSLSERNSMNAKDQKEPTNEASA
jgi:hypothetical protein